MNGFTPAEQARRDALDAMTADERARADWFADVRAVLAVAEANPGLPLPIMSHGWIRFGLYVHGGRARQALDDAEAALAAGLHVTFTGTVDERAQDYILQAVMFGGLKVQITAPAPAVAEKRVTGTTTVETAEWVRLHAGPDGRS